MQEKYFMTDYGYDTTKKWIRDEVHLVRAGEKRTLDHRMTSEYSFTANVPLNIDIWNNAFYIIDDEANAADACGFIRVAISYEAQL